MKVFAILPAGGTGKRTSLSLPKQYLEINGKELIAYTLEIFQNSIHIDEIIVAAQKDFFPTLNAIKEKYNINKLINFIEGGKERQFSVFNALKSINANDNDLIVVHDAVRPLLSQSILSSSIKVAKEFGAALVAVKTKDTLLKGNDSVVSYIDRREVFYAQTPQVFKYHILLDAMKKAEEENFIGTDESMLVHRAGYKVKIVEGSFFNFKVTSSEEINLLSIISKSY